MSGLPYQFVLRHEDYYILDPQLQGEHEHAAVGSYRSPARFNFVGGVLRLSNSGRPLARYAVEDRSLLPKRVSFLNLGDDTFGDTQLEAVGDGRYTIKTGGAPLIIQGGHLYADLAQQETPAEFHAIPA